MGDWSTACDQAAETVSERSSSGEVEGSECELQRQVEGGEGEEEREGGMGEVDIDFLCLSLGELTVEGVEDTFFKLR